MVLIVLLVEYLKMSNPNFIGTCLQRICLSGGSIKMIVSLTYLVLNSIVPFLFLWNSPTIQSKKLPMYVREL